MIQFNEISSPEELQSAVKDMHDVIYRDGIDFVKQGLPQEWADQLNQDVSTEFMRALMVPGGTAARGNGRFYFEPYAERTPGFIDLATHVAVTGLSKSMFGDDYRIVEWGSDLPLPGADAQRPHRDFPIPEVTVLQRRLVSVAINASLIDVEPNNAPFQYVKGSQFDEGSSFIGNEGEPDTIGGMFPDEEEREYYASKMQTVLGMRGNFSVRSGLMVHGGSASEVNNSRLRPTVILGVVSPEDRAWVSGPEELKERNDDHVPRVRASEEYISYLAKNQP
ncbi:MAG: Phytanoyl-CoA dioxygenase, partial [Candidatus Saccharibacteria bacterium]|nr:Phytanoyl-CoA dioxygenase [Candidatus Saccharibacteria bacterium]